MLGPEQQKMELKAKRERSLRYLRQVYEKREEQKSRSLSAEKPVNVNEDDTATAAGVPISPPLVSNTNYTTKAINEDKMPIYKYIPSSASLKRKAVDIDHDRDSEQGDKQRHGREAKKAKTSCGYFPGTGKRYRGTARERPSPLQSGLVGALRAKSTNAPLKRHETHAKQDTENLNRNTQKPGEVRGKGTSRLTQSRQIQDPLNVAGRKAIDEGATNGLQHTRSKAPNGEEVGTMAYVKYAPLSALKRKSGQDLENETTKKSKIGPSTAPPVRELKVGVNKVPQARTSSFFARIQKPGHTAAVPTNVKHVQEVLKEPVPELPKAPKTNVESPLVKEADAGASGKKRRREDDAGSEGSKKAKLSIPGPAGRKDSSITDKPGVSPKGLKNHKYTCFANASLQALFGVPELLEHYEACEKVLSDEVWSMFTAYTNLPRAQKASKTPVKQRDQLRSLVEDKCFIGAHFSQLIRHLKRADAESVSPYVFMQACGALFKDEDGSPLDGNTVQDAAQFLSELLRRLHDEELMEDTEKADPEKLSLVQELFHVQQVKQLVCEKCAHTKDAPSEPTADCYGLKVFLPTTEESITLGELLTNTRASELLADYVCSECKAMGTTTQNPSVDRLPKCLIVQAPRVRHMKGGNRKLHTSVEFPTEALDLSSLLKSNKSSESHKYEVFGIVEHIGKTRENGHYVAFRKTQGNWYRISDEKVRQVSEMELPTQGLLFFLTRV